jgi:hypothetical protein
MMVKSHTGVYILAHVSFLPLPSQNIFIFSRFDNIYSFCTFSVCNSSFPSLHLYISVLFYRRYCFSFLFLYTLSIFLFYNFFLFSSSIHTPPPKKKKIASADIHPRDMYTYIAIERLPEFLCPLLLSCRFESTRRSRTC